MHLDIHLREFIVDIGRKISDITGEHRQTEFMSPTHRHRSSKLCNVNVNDICKYFRNLNRMGQ